MLTEPPDAQSAPPHPPTYAKHPGRAQKAVPLGRAAVRQPKETVHVAMHKAHGVKK